jgi:hypothetical protein
MIEQKFMDRFMQRFQKSDGCWEWTGGMNKVGYGQFSLGWGKMHTASRVSYMIFKGEIPRGLHVCHTCDNRRCVRPDHLFLGTCLDNMTDKVRKCRAGKNQWTRHLYK